MPLLEFPTTGLIVNTKVPTTVKFLGEVDWLYFNTIIALDALNVEYPYKEQIRDLLKEPKTQGRYVGYLGGNEKNEFYYFISRQNSIQDYLFTSGHEEGHIIENLNCLIELETLMQSVNVNADFRKIDDKEIRADIAGLYVLDREKIDFNTLSKGYLETHHVKTAINLYNSFRINTKNEEQGF